MQYRCAVKFASDKVVLYRGKSFIEDVRKMLSTTGGVYLYFQLEEKPPADPKKPNPPQTADLARQCSGTAWLDLRSLIPAGSRHSSGVCFLEAEVKDATDLQSARCFTCLSLELSYDVTPPESEDMKVHPSKLLAHSDGIQQFSASDGASEMYLEVIQRSCEAILRDCQGMGSLEEAVKQMKEVGSYDEVKQSLRESIISIFRERLRKDTAAVPGKPLTGALRDDFISSTYSFLQLTAAKVFDRQMRPDATGELAEGLAIAKKEAARFSRLAYEAELLGNWTRAAHLYQNRFLIAGLSIREDPMEWLNFAKFLGRCRNRQAAAEEALCQAAKLMGAGKEVSKETALEVELFMACLVLDRGRYEEAIAIFEGKHKEDFGNPTLRFYLGLALFLRCRWEESRAYLESSGKPREWFQGLPDEPAVVDKLKAFRRSDPVNLHIFADYLEQLLSFGLSSLVFTFLDQTEILPEEALNTEPVALVDAKASSLDRNYHAAVTRLQPLLAAGASHQAWMLAGECYLQMQDFDKALQALQMAVSDNKLEDPALYIRLGSVLLVKKRWKQARDTFLRSIQFKPTAEAWSGVAYAELRSDALGSSYEALCEANLLDHERCDVWALLCLVLFLFPFPEYPAMGCCGSAIDKDTAERLETVEKQIKAVGLKTDDASLEEVAGYAKELQSLFEIFAAAADMRMLEQVQELSDVILRTLLARIDPTFLDKGPDSYQATLDRIMAVATDLDAVRATKATKMVQGHVDRLQETMHLAQEKAVDPIIKRIQAIREKLQQPGQGKNLIAGTKDILVSAEQGLKAAPGVKQVAKGLLEQLVAHSIWVLEAEAAWSNPEACDQVVELSQQVDDLAERLVKPLSATWDPPITPQAERVRQRKASEACDMLVAKASKHLEADEGGDAYHCLVELLPWWPSLKSSRSLEIVGLFSKMQSYAHEAFLTAAKGGDTSAAEEIRGFAMQFDELRGKFTGLPEASGSRPLGEALEAGEAKIQVAKSLDIVDAEVAKTTDDDESTNLSLGTTIEALEALKVAWPLGGQDDSELEERLQRSCRGLEDFTFEAINTSPVEQLTSLMQFAQEYDVRHSILVPGSDALRPKLATKAALKCLQRAEGELEKTEGMKPHVLLDSLKALIAINPDASDADIRTHLLRVMASTNERLLKSFSEAISAEAENEKKELLLHKFAESADEVRTALSVPGDSLVAAMQTKRGEVAEELIDSIQDQINGQQFSLSKEINALSRILKKLPEDSEVRSNAVAVAGKFVEALSSAPVTEVEKLLESSHDGHLGQALKDLQCDMPDLRAKMLSRVVHAHLETARSSGSDLADLEKELEILEKLRKDEAVSADIYVEISKFADSMEEPFLKKMLQDAIPLETASPYFTPV
eukprot:symbB.v1.2.014652.t1/scaffold1063.1/size201213/7